MSMKRRVVMAMIVALCFLSLSYIARRRIRALANRIVRNFTIDPPILSASEAAATCQLASGFRLNVFASEPAVQQPLGMAFDDRGRLWVAERHGYELRGDGTTDRIVVFDDVDGDGKHDERIVFAEGLERLSGVEVGWGGVWVACAPNLLFFPDQDADAHPDGPAQVVLEGWDPKPRLEHHWPNHLSWGPDGWLYGCSGLASRASPHRVGEKPKHELNAGVWRLHPKTHEFEVVAHGTCNPWGIDFDSVGRLFVSNNVVEHLWYVIPGGHYKRWGSQDLPFVYEPMESCVDHLHWFGESSGGALKHWKGGSPLGQTGDLDQAGDRGGHSHAGLLIYQGGAWPDDFRDHAFMGNIHGNRISHDSLDMTRPFPVAQHQPDLIRMKDLGFRCVDVKCGFDGQVYACDWSASGYCHESDLNGTGRIYRISWGEVTRAVQDLGRLSPEELLDLQQHSNEIIARRARVRLHFLDAQGQVSEDVRSLGWQRVSDTTKNQGTRLRYLWTCAGWSHKVPQLETILETLQNDPEPMIRAWACRLSMELAGPTPKLISKFISMLKSDPPIPEEVFVELISLGRLIPIKARKEFLPALLGHAHLELRRDYERLAWSTFEPLVADDPAWAVDLLDQISGEYLQYAVARRVANLWLNHSSDSFEALMGRLLNIHLSPRNLLARAKGIAAELTGQQKPPPKELELVVQALSKSEDPEVRAVVHVLPASVTALGRWKSPDEAALIVKSRSEDINVRLLALDYCVSKMHQTRLWPLLLSLAEDENLEMAGAAIRAMPIHDDPQTAGTLLTIVRTQTSDRRQIAMEALASRRSFAETLLSAIETNAIPSSELPAELARSISRMDSGVLAARVTKVWGKLEATSGNQQPEVRRLRKLLISAIEKNSPTGHGRDLFKERCAHCHRYKTFDTGWGPNLNAAKRDNLDFWLNNILDPNAAVPKLYLNHIIELDDGRVLTGAIINENENSITLRSPREERVVSKSKIESRRESSESAMPTGILNGLSDNQIVDLFQFLMKFQ